LALHVAHVLGGDFRLVELLADGVAVLWASGPGAASVETSASAGGACLACVGQRTFVKLNARQKKARWESGLKP
jgi:hypothetical protein